MAVQCFNHPGRAAEGKCVECGNAICGECRTIVKSRPVCGTCLEKIREKLVADIEAMPEPSPEQIASQIESTFDLPARPIHGRETVGKSVAVATRPVATTKKEPEPLPVLTQQRLITGIVFGALVGTIGAWCWDKVNMATGFKFGFAFLVTLFVGAAISCGVLLGTRRGGNIPAVIAAFLTLASQVLGYYLYFNDHNLQANPAFGGLSVGQFFQMTPTIGGGGTFMIAMGILTAFMVALHVRSGAKPKPMI